MNGKSVTATCETEREFVVRHLIEQLHRCVTWNWLFMRFFMLWFGCFAWFFSTTFWKCMQTGGWLWKSIKVLITFLILRCSDTCRERARKQQTHKIYSFDKWTFRYESIWFMKLDFMHSLMVASCIKTMLMSVEMMLYRKFHTFPIFACPSSSISFTFPYSRR